MIEYSRLPWRYKNCLKRSTEKKLRKLQARGKIWDREISQGDLPPGIEGIRVIGPDNPVTCDWVTNRLNINIDGDGKIESWAWG